MANGLERILRLVEQKRISFGEPIGNIVPFGEDILYVQLDNTVVATLQNGQEVARCDLAEGLPDNPEPVIEDMAVDNSGRLYATIGGGISVVEGGHLRKHIHCDHDESDDSSPLSTLHAAQTGSLVCAVMAGKEVTTLIEGDVLSVRRLEEGIEGFVAGPGTLAYAFTRDNHLARLESGEEPSFTPVQLPPGAAFEELVFCPPDTVYVFYSINLRRVSRSSGSVHATMLTSGHEQRCIDLDVEGDTVHFSSLGSDVLVSVDNTVICLRDGEIVERIEFRDKVTELVIETDNILYAGVGADQIVAVRGGRMLGTTCLSLPDSPSVTHYLTALELSRGTDPTFYAWTSDGTIRFLKPRWHRVVPDEDPVLRGGD